jgi:hypothetical protein
MVRTLRLGAALLFVAGGLLVPGALAPAASAASATVPYTDPSAVGAIGLCDKQGHQVTSGNINDQPFVWTAVSSAPAPAAYRTKTAKAVLQAFQPRPGTQPGEWSGEQLTGSSTFSNPQHPMAQATVGDNPLVWFTGSYPPRWKGFVQLRMYFSAPNQTEYSYTYPATDIQVTGSTWHVVRGANVPCNVGTAVSAETQLLTQAQIEKNVIDKSSVASPGATVGVGAVSPTAQAGSTPGAIPTLTVGAAPAASSSSSTGGSSSSGKLLGVALLVLAALGGGALLWRRRRSA